MTEQSELLWVDPSGQNFLSSKRDQRQSKTRLYLFIWPCKNCRGNTYEAIGPLPVPGVQSITQSRAPRPERLCSHHSFKCPPWLEKKYAPRMGFLVYNSYHACLFIKPSRHTHYNNLSDGAQDVMRIIVLCARVPLNILIDTPFQRD